MAAAFFQCDKTITELPFAQIIYKTFIFFVNLQFTKHHFLSLFQKALQFCGVSDPYMFIVLIQDIPTPAPPNAKIRAFTRLSTLDWVSGPSYTV